MMGKVGDQRKWQQRLTTLESELLTLEKSHEDARTTERKRAVTLEPVKRTYLLKQKHLYEAGNMTANRYLISHSQSHLSKSVVLIVYIVDMTVPSAICNYKDTPLLQEFWGIRAKIKDIKYIERMQTARLKRVPFIVYIYVIAIDVIINGFVGGLIPVIGTI
ncbi:hypothetical protein NDU88_002033 [Pleurodeles waltl]|uniref:Uncharacterized protein n=1 Tax=Pleurodeles waltl TaxID=8319 RepID=A0AAV7TKH2_PLEWA|nr:hypothetical protein NDU88_002033 [Pleurodeles waltl]